MLDEEMDDIIKQAAEQHHPSYDNKAWDKMEQLLDKHLPQKKDRRGIIFFLVLGLLIGAGLFVGGYYFMSNRDKNATIASVDTKNAVKKSPVTQSSAPVTNSIVSQSTVPSVNANSVNANDNNATAQLPIPNKDNSVAGSSSKQQHGNSAFKVGSGAAKTSVSVTSGSAATDDGTLATRGSQPANRSQQEKNATNSDLTKITTTGVDENTIKIDIKKDAVENKQDVQPLMMKAADVAIAKDAVKENTVDPVNKKTDRSTEKKTSKNSIASNFGLSFSAGADVSFVELNKPGKITLAYGAGLSYTFFKKLTLQSGFYVSRKIYTADSADYHAPNGFWTTYRGMDNTVAANCKVYEVPVNLMYNFKQKGKHNLYAGAGLSTYFMKHEGYDYSYTYAGIVYPKSIVIDNQNQHNFSVLTLAGGYKYNLSPRVAVSAEPYVKLPLNGIGFGKVKLKGGGVMMNLTLKPFAKKK